MDVASTACTSDGETGSEMGDFIVYSDESDEDAEYTQQQQPSEDDGESDESTDDDDVTSEADVPESVAIGDAPESLEGMSEVNILPPGSKRARKQPERLTDQIFGSKSYAKMMMCDVPEDEVAAALYDSDWSSEDESEQDAYSDDDTCEEDWSDVPTTTKSAPGKASSSDAPVVKKTKPADAPVAAKKATAASSDAPIAKKLKTNDVPTTPRVIAA